MNRRNFDSEMPGCPHRLYFNPSQECNCLKHLGLTEKNHSQFALFYLGLQPVSVAVSDKASMSLADGWLGNRLKEHGSWLGLACGASALLLCLLLAIRRCSPRPVVFRVLIVIYISILVRCIDYTIIIPTVYGTAHRAHASAAVSGCIVGVYHGAGIFSCVLHAYTPIGSLSFRSCTFLCLATYPVGSLMYMLGASVQFGPATLSLTLISRGICGIAEGLIGTAHHSMLARLASANSQKDLFMLYTLVESMGAALGPITSSTLLLSVAPLVPSLPQGAVPVLCMFVIHMLVFFLACIFDSFQVLFNMFPGVQLVPLQRVPKGIWEPGEILRPDAKHMRN